MTQTLLLRPGARKRIWHACLFVFTLAFMMLYSTTVQAQTYNLNLCKDYTNPNQLNSQYRVCLTTVSYDFATNKSTWTYTYQTLAGNNISHIVFLGNDCAKESNDFFGAVGCGVFTIDDVNIQVLNNADKETNLLGIKFNCSNDAANPRTVSFTLNGIYSVGTIQVGLKPGNDGITGTVAGPSCTTIANNKDYGDLPDTYKTLAASNGPSHLIASNINMGTNIDVNTDGSPSASANGDDNNSTDDEDGISSFPTFTAGQTATVTVNLTNTTGNPARLYGFIDWNNDGDFNDVNEAPTAVTVANNASTAMITFNVPFGAVTGTNLGARFRLTTNDLGTGGIAASGVASDGEVEDYTVIVQSNSSDCGDAFSWMQSYSLIAFGNLNQMQEGEGSVFVAGNLNLTNTFQIGINLNTANYGNSGARKSLEVAGGVIGGTGITMLNYSAAFASSVNYTSGNQGTVQIIGGGTRTINLNNNGALSNVSIMQDLDLPAKAAKMEADLTLASTQLCNTANTSNYTFNYATQNASLTINNNNVVVVNLSATEAATFFSTVTTLSISTPNNASYSAPIIFNVKGTSFNVPGGFNMGNIPTELFDNVIWNFCEATSINIPTAVKGSLLAPLANVTLGNNIDGVLVAQDVSIGSESHLPFLAADFSTYCATCSISAQFTQECVGSNATKITVLVNDAPSGQYIVKQGATTVAGPAANGTIVTFNGAVNTLYTVVDNTTSSCSTTFTTSNQITGCDQEETCPNADFFDMTIANGFRKPGLLGETGNFNAIIGGSFTTNGVGDTEGRLAVGGDFSNTGAGLFTIGGGNPSGTGGFNAAMGEDNLIVTGNIDGPVGVRGNIVYGGTASDISFIAGTGGVGLQRDVNDVAINVLNIAGAITYFQGKSTALFTCAYGTQGTVSGSGTVTLDGLNATGLVVFNLSNANANTSYNFVNVSNATAILINVGSTTATFSGGAIQLNGVTVPTYPIDNAPTNELAFVKKTLWNFPNATTFNLTSYAIMGSVLAPSAAATLSGGGINGQTVFGGNVTTSGGFEFHNFCYDVDIETACTPTYDYGDLPDNGDGTGTGNYETTFANGGPRHQIVSTLKMGTNIDAESDGQQSTTANGDDTNSTDDEDGVTFPTLIPGATVNVTVSLTNTTGGSANLYGFIDWNNDGDFADANEAPTAVIVANNASSAIITFSIPTSAVSGTSVGARFRLTTNSLGAGAAASEGSATDGEVEDYWVTIACAPPSIGDCETPVITFTGFTGAGFSPNPSAGQLCSGAWVVTGLSDGNGTLGGTHTSGDFARGNDDNGGVTEGGVYAVNNGSGNPALWLQPTEDDLTSGTITTVLCNNTGSTVTDLVVGYDILVYNNQDRSNSFNFSYAKGNVGTLPGSFTSVSALNYNTPGAATGTTIITVPRLTVLNGINLAAGECIYLRWTTNDVSGSGSRDEIGLDNIIVSSATNCREELCTTSSDTYLLNFDIDQNGNTLTAGTSNITTTPPYNNIFGGGMGITFSTDAPSTNPLNLYNSENTGGQDPDLERNSSGSGTWAFGNIPTENLKNLLIINETNNIAIPNDEANGGKIFSISSMFLQEIAFDIVDLENVGTNDVVKFENTATGETVTVKFTDFLPGSGTPFATTSVAYGERSANRITGITAQKLGISAFNQITFDTDDSFGIGSICIKKARTDFGDLLSTWQQATAIVGPDTNNDGKPESNPANASSAAVWAGVIVDTENMQLSSMDVLGDDNSASSTGGDDEDGLTFPGGNLDKGQTYNYTLTTNSSSAGDITRYWGLWFDWDNNGTFETFYSGNVNGTGSVAVVQAVMVPNSAVNDYKVRLVVSSGQVTNTPGGTFTNAEVEDYANTTLLPIELLDFTVTLNQAQQSVLKWRTASEKNNAYFSIQRSRDGITWQEIGQKKGAGNSQTVQHYDFIDPQPLPGNNYYRFQQFDFDGAFEYSPVRLVTLQDTKETAYLYPNPTTNLLNVQFSSNDTKEDRLMEIFNITGQQVKADVQSVGNGFIYTIDTTRLVPGTYILRIKDQSGTNVQILRFVRQ